MLFITQSTDKVIAIIFSLILTTSFASVAIGQEVRTDSQNRQNATQQLEQYNTGGYWWRFERWW
jgi:hypothetical protein